MAIEKSCGELIAFQDSDDEWHPDKLKKQVELILNSPPDVGAVYCGMEFYNIQTGEKIGEDLQNDNLAADFMSGSHLPHTPATQTV
jgi:hypothetical protein